MAFNETCRKTCWEDEFYVLLEYPLFQGIKKKTYIKQFHWTILNMPKFIELMKTENKIEIRNLSMFIMTSFDISVSFLFNIDNGLNALII